MMAAARVGDAEASLTALQEAPDLAAVAGKAVAPEPSADSAGVTTAMVAEEAALAQAAAERERQTASKARAVVDDMAPEVRASRLDTLLQKSSLFAEFLKDKIQQVNQQRRDEQQQQQQEAPPVAGGKRRSPKRKATKRRASASSSSADTSADTSAGADAGAAGTVLQDGTVVSGRQPKLVTGGELREYQLEGVEWLLVRVRLPGSGQCRCDRSTGRSSSRPRSRSGEAALPPCLPFCRLLFLPPCTYAALPRCTAIMGPPV